MIIINNRVFVDIKIDNTEIPSSANLVERITMTEGNGALTPAIELIFNDTSGHLGRELNLTDGNEILVTLGRSPGDIKTVSRQYRLFGQKQIVTGFGPQIKAIGTLDAPGYLSGSARESFKGTSSQAITELAVKSKMCYSGPEDYNGRTLNDSQIWSAVCSTRAIHAQEIARHAWLDPHSAMMLTATSLGCLKFRNLSDVMETPVEKINRIFIHSIPPASTDSAKVMYEVRQAKDRSVAGLMNNWQNYGSTRFEHTLDGTQKAHNEVGVKTGGSFLPINDQVSRTIEKSRREYGPLDCGNTHKEYSKALYQNIKLLGLFSEKLSILTLDVTDVQLLDPVIYRQANADLTEPVKNTDVYIVIGKTILLKGGMTYVERLELARMSITTKGKSVLKCATPAQDAASVVPAVSIDPTSKVATTTLPQAKALAATAAPATAALGKLKNAAPAVTGAIKGTFSSITGLVNTLKTAADPRAILGKIQAAIPGLSTLKEVVGNVRSTVGAAAGAYRDLNTMVADVKNIGPAIKGSMLQIPGGIMDSYSSSMGTMKQLGGHADVMRSVDYSLAPHRPALNALPGGSASMSQFDSLTSSIADNTGKIGTGMSSMWNTSISTFTGAQIPPGVALPAPAGKTLQQGSLENVVDYSFKPTPRSTSKSLSSTELSNLAQTEMLKTDGQGKPRWQAEAPLRLGPVLNLDEASNKLKELERDGDSATKRAQSYPSNWA